MELILSRATRKYEAVDLLKLYTENSFVEWNKYLDTMYHSNNINALARMRYSLQAGMDDLSKTPFHTEAIAKLYIRLLRSVEITATKVIRRLHPMPHDNPHLHGAPNQPERPAAAQIAKRNRDKALETFFNDSSF